MTDIERKIVAAQGYVELQLYAEAREELRGLPSEALERVEVVELRLLCLMMGEGCWAEALPLSKQLCEMEPEEPGGFIHAAYCLHELGRTAEALDLLRKGPSALRTKPVFFYNLGCYHASLGQHRDALKCLEQSFEMDGCFRRMAKEDPDLKSLWAVLEKH